MRHFIHVFNQSNGVGVDVFFIVESLDGAEDRDVFVLPVWVSHRLMCTQILPSS